MLWLVLLSAFDLFVVEVLVFKNHIIRRDHAESSISQTSSEGFLEFHQDDLVSLSSLI